MRTRVEKIVEDFYLLRVDDTRVRFFEALWEIPEGITYNAYLLFSEDRVLLFDTWKRAYSELFIETLREVVNPREIDILVTHHTEPDHSGSIPLLLEHNEKLKIIGHPLAKGMLESFYGIKFDFKPAKDGEEINLDGKLLKFIHTLWLHWPETIMTFIPEDGILLSGDAFGGYSTPNELFDEGSLENYLKFVRKYIVTVIGHYRKFITRNIDKIMSLKIVPKIIAPAHGLVFKRNPNIILNYYLKIAKAEPQEKKVTIIYSSMYGSVEKAVKIVVKELEENNVTPKVYGITDEQSPPLSELLSDVIDSQALVVGAATYEADVFPKIKWILDLIASKSASSKPVLVLLSYGWGGVAGNRIVDTLKKAGFQIVGKVEFKGAPGLEEIREIKRIVAKLL